MKKRSSIIFIAFMIIASFYFSFIHTGETSVFIIPHQDDEVLSFSVAILEELSKGNDVHLLLLTEGTKTIARQMINGEYYCEWHEKHHSPEKEGYDPLSEFMISSLRQLEYKASLEALGVLNKHDANPWLVDSKVSVEDVKDEMRRLSAEMERVHLHAFHPTLRADIRHSDHLASGQAAKELAEEKGYDVTYYVEPYVELQLPEDTKTLVLRPTVAQSESIRLAAKAYMNWDPKEDHFGIGYHSIKRYMDQFLRDMRTIIVTE